MRLARGNSERKRRPLAGNSLRPRRSIRPAYASGAWTGIRRAAAFAPQCPQRRGSATKRVSSTHSPIGKTASTSTSGHRQNDQQLSNRFWSGATAAPFRLAVATRTTVPSWQPWLTFILPTRHFTECHSATNPAWFYRFDYAHPLLGATHALDLASCGQCAAFWPWSHGAGR